MLSDAQKAKMPVITHRIARRHPVTGKKALYAVSGSSFGIVGMPDDEARDLLDELAAHSTAARYQTRLRYGVVDIVVWDKRRAAAFGHADRPRRRPHPVADHRPRACARSGGAGGSRADVRAAAMIRVSAFRWVPPFAQGLVRDLRVSWAMEEAGLEHTEPPIGPEDQDSDAYRALQPFGQVPVLEDDDTAMFESGAIVLHIAERAPALMPDDGHARERVRSWMLAALNSVEPPIMMLVAIDSQPPDALRASQALRDTIVGRIDKRLDGLARFLGTHEHLVDGRFTAADLLMTTVLRIPRHTDVVTRRPALDAYRKRNESRPAFQKALDAQLATFARHQPPAR